MIAAMPMEITYSRLDRAVANFLGRRSGLSGPQQAAFEALVAKLSYQQTQGHSSLLLSASEQALVLASRLALAIDFEANTNADPNELALPLVLERDRLYLQRYWAYEQRLSEQLKAKVQQSYVIAELEKLLDRYFDPPMEGTIDWQRAAAKMALQQAFSIITGGPGTGKTTTVVKILALMQEVAAQPLHIALAAPTGKAAMRLQESIGQRILNLPCSEAIKQVIPETVTTIHRLLGAKPASPYFHHSAEQPLVYDLVVVDEASMVDLALMSKLVDALKPGARLILLGDKDQLASVESGAVLADLTFALPEHTVELKTSHRFDGNIKALAEAVNAQQATPAWQLLQEQGGNVTLLTEDKIAYIAAQQHEYLRLIKSGAAFQAVFQAFMRFQVLCSNRQGPNSIDEINYQVEQLLARQNLINLAGLWYTGRPVMITQNNLSLHLYNGDIGICMPDVENAGKLRVFFLQPDGRVKKYLPARITHCETVYAMTVHKSQGSEFDEVLVVLPELMNPVLTKELLYTALTRAKKTLKLVTGPALFKAAIEQKIQRVTGLVDKLTRRERFFS